MDAGVGLFTTDVPNTLRLVGTLGLSTPDALYAFVVDFGEEQAYLGTKWFLWFGTSGERSPAVCSWRSAKRTRSGILNSSVPSLSSPSVRPKRNVRGVSCRRFEEIQHGATVDRVTADGTVMFELWRTS